MLNETQITTEQFEVYRDGALDPTFKRKIVIKKSKAVLMAILGYFGGLGLALGSYVVMGIIHTLQDVKRNVMLDVVDYRYHTSLRKQYHSGKRTQAILSTKKLYGI